ncbi:MAG TPA: T9SS type A sorting domain-containing protein [Catalimonadaceae bacterium]|jgi:hypothetical protein|nr:T9SS type A sorting domain-containing protein [Catalimonadaceae bacterium]
MKSNIVFAVFLALALQVFSNRTFASQAVSNYEMIGDSSLSAKTNPFDARIINGRLVIKFQTGNSNGVVGLHDILGNKVFESTSGENIDFSMAGLRSGVYFLVWKDNRNSFTRRIVFRQEN